MHMLFQFLIKNRKPLYRGSLKSIRIGTISSKLLANPQTSISISTARTSNLLQIRCKSAKTGPAFLIPAMQNPPKQTLTSTKCSLIQTTTITRDELHTCTPKYEESNPFLDLRSTCPLEIAQKSNGQVNRRFNSRLDPSYLGMHMCNSFLEMVIVWMREHFVEVRVPEMVI